MSSLFKNPNHVAQLSRNGFDMSQRRTFSCPCGMLLPTYTDFAIPGDKYKLNSRSFVRTEALQSAAFSRMKAHLDWFFVPITQIYSLWNEVYNGTNDIMSGIYDMTKIRPALPCYSLVDITMPFASVLKGKMFTQLDNSPSSGSSVVTYKVDEFGVPLLYNFRRLASMLYGQDFFYKGLNSEKKFSPLALCAYHKIFHSHYRNTYYTANDPSMYSLDKYYSLDNTDPSAIYSLFKIHYRPWRRDLFTFVQPAPVWQNGFADYIKDSFSVPSKYDINPEASGSLSTVDYSQSIESLIGQTPAIGSSFGVSESENLQGFSVGDVRAMFALDKLLRITASTGSHYDEQTLAHFGYKMPQGISNEVYFLGEQQLEININEVVATASTGIDAAGGTIGDIAGKGFGATQNSEDLEFTAPCHGYIMAVWSIEPIPEYRNIGDVTANYRDGFDFFHPEFDGLGMQPFDDSLFGLGDNITGWQWRYMQHKTKLNGVDESIFDTNKSSWATSRYFTPVTFESLQARFYIYPQYTNSIFLLDFPAYTASTGSSSVNLQFTAKTNLISQFVWADPEYPVDANGNPIVDSTYLSPSSVLASANIIYSYDNFICVVDHSVFKTSCMKKYSLPQM
ncbi:major capsid protein [Sigmofec virus UA08Rod_4258]|uniref:Major capsid protein n=1 Tax=Sigmofec virus UA08Rod_4258 TaxID=2929397 RepID=A0A976N1F6_9VIRU|nr:major capsid protein [Sigmofec virus UA08Rod_4258]